MNSNLLSREKELFKINEQINASSPKLFNKNEVIHIKQIFKEGNQITDVQTKTALNEACIETINSNNECLVAGQHERNANLIKNNLEMYDYKNKVLMIPKVFQRQNVNKDNLVEFLKSKVAILQNEMQQINENNKNLNEQLKIISKKCRDAVGLSEKQQDINTTLKQENYNFTLKTQDNQIQRSILNQTIIQLTTENENLNRELIKCQIFNKNIEKRLQKALAESEDMKERLNTALSSEKETRSSASKDCRTLENQVKNLKAERIKMLNLFKKQLLHTENLKKQSSFFDEMKLIEVLITDLGKLSTTIVSEK